MRGHFQKVSPRRPGGIFIPAAALKPLQTQRSPNIIINVVAIGSLGDDPMTPEKFKRKLTAILSADVKGYSRLIGRAGT